MQTSFYVSGFLYSPKTHKILLVQPKQLNDLPITWSTLGGEGLGDEDAGKAFQKIVSKHLDITLKPKDIYPIYDYFHDVIKKPNFVFYAEVKNPKIASKTKKGSISWFSFSEIVKLKFNQQTKQDLVVGERVISAKWRDDEAKRYPEDVI